MVNGDVIWLCQVLHNLFHNVYDVMQQSVVWEIVVCMENLDGFIKMSVLDCGIGFLEQILVCVFEFYMIIKIKGIGLGLPIVKKIVEEYSGSIYIENREGGGTCVSIFLPIVAAQDFSMVVKQILVVDDEIGIREFLLEILYDE